MSFSELPPPRWEIVSPGTIRWNVSLDKQLPHADNLEMSGRHLSVIVHYELDADRKLKITREIIWPALRLKRDDVRGYLIRSIEDSAPKLRINGALTSLPPVRTVRFNGVLTFEYAAIDGLTITRSIFPAVTSGALIETWKLKNGSRKAILLDREEQQTNEPVKVYNGECQIAHRLGGITNQSLPPGSALQIDDIIEAHLIGSKPIAEPDSRTALKEREALIRAVQGSLQLVSPDPALNCAFDLAKLRAAESLFETKMGLVHSPGGGRYYGGVWANDQAEYAGPFFPFLGYQPAIDASLNAYKKFASEMTSDYTKSLPSSFEVEGDVLFRGAGDRGDAAMIAYGASRYALALGSKKTAQELWPAITWCLEYCRRKTNADGVVESNSDELEGRFPTGKANLSTSTLTYGALRSAASLARSLGKQDVSTEYEHRAADLEYAIQNYFSATIDGYNTYRYYDGNKTLRAWICLPLTMGIARRRAGTIEALFSPKLWTADGLATEAGDKVFWDRSTLYALRGVLQAGSTELAMEKLSAYTRRRLLGEHVPYPVEAWPEGGQAHLSAESALYCRVITEGLFGLNPIGLEEFTCMPRLPADWPEMSLKNVSLCGRRFTLKATRREGRIYLTVTASGHEIYAENQPESERFTINFAKKTK